MTVLPDISAAIGSTPLVHLSRLFPGREVFAKIESLNPGGSTKDRPALSMLDDALDRGIVAAGGTVIESSSGNLGMALARSCALRGVRFVCVMDARANRSTMATIRALGGDIEQITEPDPETGDFLTARVKRVNQLLDEIPGSVNLYQYGNPANPRAHRHGTMREIAEALDHRIDAMVAAVSTTGTVGGCAAYIAERGMETRLIAVDAEGSALFGGTPGPRAIPGMGAGFVTDLSRTVAPDAVERVSEIDCVAGCRLLASREGILAGGSTGGIVATVSRLLKREPEVGRVAMLVHDDGMPYLDTVYNDDWIHETLGASITDVRNRMTELAA